MTKFLVEFKHVEETTYIGWVEAESEAEAQKMVYDEPFDINDLEDTNVQGLEVIDIYVEESEEE